MSTDKTREIESHCFHIHQSNNWLWKDASVDANIIRGKAAKKQDIHRISKYLSTDYLLIAKEKNTFIMGKSGRYTFASDQV